MSIIFQVLKYEELSGNVLRVFLSQSEKLFHYHAGQYVEFILPEEPPRPFSIANCPNDHVIEFHIRHSIDNAYTLKLIKHIQETKQLELNGPFGKMHYQKNPNYPLLFLAAGTGVAPCKAIIEEALKDQNCPEIYLYWVARKKEDLYLDEELKNLTKINYIPILSSEGRVYEIALRDHPDLSKFHIYASGPSEMVFAAQKAFNYPKYFYSDWLGLIS